MQLKEYIDKAVSRSETKELFVSTLISEKLVRGFDGKEGKKLYAVSVPIYENDADKASFYEIVVPQERIRIIPDSNQVKISLFKHTPEGGDYTFTAKKSFDNGEGGYDTVTLTLTSEDVIAKIEQSREKYKEAHAASNDCTLADVMAGQGTEPQNNQMQNGFRRHSGR